MVSLKALVESIDFTSHEEEYHLNLKTGEILLVTGEYISLAEDEDDEKLPEWMMEIIPDVRHYLKNQDDYLTLPDKQDFDEYRVMEDFIETLSDPEQQNTLEKATTGKGAFRRFKDKVIRLDLDDQWYKFKDAALAEYVKDWAKENNIQLSA